VRNLPQPLAERATIVARPFEATPAALYSQSVDYNLLREVRTDDMAMRCKRVRICALHR